MSFVSKESPKKFRFFPLGNFCSIEELETALQFKFLPQITFENAQEQAIIYERGLKHAPSSEALELGHKYIHSIKKAYIPQVSIHELGKKVGYGLFTEEDIPINTYVGEYTGIVRKDNQRYFAPMNNYCYEYPVLDELGKSHVIDATSGNLTRFINHSYKPNLKPIHVFHGGYYHLIFISLLNIKKGEQLCYNYGRRYWYVRSPPEDL